MPYRAKPDNYLEELNEIPPFMCVILARHKNRTPITTSEIAKACGWSEDKVENISKMRSWESVAVGDADKFRTACGVTRKQQHRQRFYIKRTLDPDQVESPLLHTRKLGEQSRRRIIKLIKQAA